MSDSIETKGKIIALTVVFCISAIVAGFVIIEINKQDNPQQTENQRIVTNMQEIKNVVDKAYNQGKEDAELIHKINERKKFINDITDNIRPEILTKQRLFDKEFYFTVENKSEYCIEKVIYEVNYYKNVNSYEVLSHTEYVEFYNLKEKERQTKQIPYAYCSNWKWKIKQIICPELDLNYPENN